MSDETYFELKQNTLKLYKSIGFIICNALDNTEIYFNSHGFRHFIYTSAGKRPIEDQMRRFKLLPHALIILNDQRSRPEEVRTLGKVTFISVENEFHFPSATVVIRKIGTGKPHFFSIIPKKRKDPNKGLS